MTVNQWVPEFFQRNFPDNFIDLGQIVRFSFGQTMVSSIQRKLATCAAVTLAAFSLAGCGKDSDRAAWWQGEQERIGLGQQLELKNFRFEQACSDDLENLERLRQAAKETASMLDSLRQRRVSLGGEVESLERNRVAFRESMIRAQRQRATGKTFEALNLVSGRKFHDVSVASIDDAGVTIRHVNGSARLRFADLDAKQREFFGLEADLALVAEEKESRDAAAYGRWIDQQMAAARAKDEAVAKNVTREDLGARQARSLIAAQQVAASNARPLAQPSTSVGIRSWSSSGSYSNYRVNRPTYRYVYYSTPSYDYSPCLPQVSVQTGRAVGTGYVCPTVRPKCKSIVDTTIPAIP